MGSDVRVRPRLDQGTGTALSTCCPMPVASRSPESSRTTSRCPTTAGSTAYFGCYGCTSDTYDGHEKIYSIDVTGTTQLDITVSNFDTRDLSAFLLPSCEPCSCHRFW